MIRFLVVAAMGLWSSIANPVFERIDARGLPEEAAMTLGQDRAGFIWIGTQGGLARFDGYHYRNYLPDPSNPSALPDGYVRALAPDERGGMWIGTSTNGLVRYDPARDAFTTWRPDPTDRTGPRSGEVNAIQRLPGGTLVVGGDGGVDAYDPRTRRFSPLALGIGAQPVVWCLLRSRDGTLWAGAQDGLFRKPPGARGFERVALPGRRTIYSLLQDDSGRIWAGSVNALLLVERGRFVRAVSSSADDDATLAPGQQWALIEPKPGVLWAGTDNAISAVDLRSFAVQRIGTDADNPNGLSGGRVVGFLRERSGLIVIANHIGGVLIYNPYPRGIDDLSGSRPQTGPSRTGGALALAAGPARELWVGGLGGTLVELDPRRGRIRRLALPTGAAIQALLRESDGSLWIGTTGGLCRLAAGAEQPQCPAGAAAIGRESVYSLLDDGTRLWVGGSDGLIGVARDGAIVAYRHGAGSRALPNDQVRALLLDRRGRLWIGTENGLDRRERDGSIVDFRFDPHDPRSIGVGGMTALLEDRQGRIWAGANGGPLNIISPDGSARHLGVADGMPHENVDGLALDRNGTMWAATDRGIAMIDTRTLRIRALGAADGVSESGYWAGTVAQDAQGTIFFGGLSGTTVIENGASSQWSYAPPVVATNLPSTTIDASNGARNISVEFAALDYSAPSTLQYQYKLDGYDRDWIPADAMHRSATYTHLPPGTYTLEVRATNRLGRWNGAPLRIAVDVSPAWYETWLFRALLVALAALVAYGAHRIRTSYLRRRQIELESIVERRTRELQELSLSDPLTGLRNRRFITEQLDAESAIALRTPGTGFTIFLIDVDTFKTVNDRYGHLAGDALLVQMRERLLEVFRGSDYVARWGGDEFLAIARSSNRSDAPELAERLRSKVATRPFSIGGDATIPANVSIGFASFPFIDDAPEALGWPQVLALADQALYLAKNAGRNTWCGLSATERTHVALIAHGLDMPIEEAEREGTLRVLRAKPADSRV